MSPSPPRKLRTGRRQFASDPSGSEQEWQRVLQDPKVKAALQDPGIGQALYHNLQGTVPGGMSGLLPPKAAAPPGPPLRMQDGGLSKDEQIRLLRAEAARTDDITEKNRIQAQITQLESAKVNDQMSNASLPLPGGGNVSGGSMAGLSKLGASGPPTAGNMAAAIGMGALMGLGTTRQQGLSSIVGAGTAGLLNYFIRKHGSKRQDAQRDANNPTMAAQPMAAEPNLSQPAGSTTGATPDAQQLSSGTYGPTGGPESVPGLPNVGALPSTAIATGDLGSGPPGGLRMGSANSPSGNVISYDGGKTWVDQQQTKKPFEGAVRNQTQINPASSLVDATPATTPPPETDQGSSTFINPPATTNPLGPAFMANQQRRLDRGLIPRGTASDPAPGWDDRLEVNTGPRSAAALGDLPMSDSSYMDPFYGTGGFGLPDEMAEGGPVQPSGLKAALPIPVLHIMIAAKPKKKAEKKSMGGHLKQADRRPRKPQAIPPVRGPEEHLDRPRAHGRVQVPRGSGAAIKGKRFGGIY